MKGVLLAPGPSMSQAAADSVRGWHVGVINNSYELAPWADFIAATDEKWWRKNPTALEFAGRKFSPNEIKGVERIKGKTIHTPSNSGVVALEVARQLGWKTIYLLGFDMTGSHFFGAYTNGLSNTPPDRREMHQKQYRNWRNANPDIEVINCTEGSALEAFPHGTFPG